MESVIRDPVMQHFSVMNFSVADSVDLLRVDPRAVEVGFENLVFLGF